MLAKAASEELDEAARVYSVCFFGRDWNVPEVQLLEAKDDQGAVVLTRSMRPWLTRELWHRHRLVQILPPSA